MNPVFVKFFESLALAIAPILAAALAAYLVTLAAKIWKQIKTDRPDIAYILLAGARMAVQAAEQAGLAGLIENKKAYALDFLENYLKTQGIPINIKLLDAAIEAAVYNEFKKFKNEGVPELESGDVPV
jgi:hypothetical protein